MDLRSGCPFTGLLMLTGPALRAPQRRLRGVLLATWLGGPHPNLPVLAFLISFFLSFATNSLFVCERFSLLSQGIVGASAIVNIVFLWVISFAFLPKQQEKEDQGQECSEECLTEHFCKATSKALQKCRDKLHANIV